MMAQAQRAVAGRSGAAAWQKGKPRCADAEAKTMNAFHFHVRASPCPGLLALLLYLQLTYMGLGPLELEGPVPPHYSNPTGPGLKPLFGMSQQFLSSVAQSGAASHQLNHFWRTFIPGWPALYMAWEARGSLVR